jgi:hypothetical protein
VFPRARKEHVTISELPDETLVYDHERHKGHCLNATAALVWRHCDGKTSVDALVKLVAEEMATDQAAAVVALALEQLGRRHLLVEAPKQLPPGDRVSRREALKQLALAAAVLPLILTVATKAAAQSMSDTGPPSDPPPPAPPVQVVVPIVVAPAAPSKSTATSPPAPPCRSRGQSCLATASGQQGTCCAGLTCTGVAQGAGVCG